MNSTFSCEGFIPLKSRLEQFQCPVYTANNLPSPHPFPSPQPPFLQQTGVHLFVSLTLAHTLKYPDTWVSVQGRSAAPRGTNGRTAWCGQGGGGARRWGRAVSLLESHRRIWSETETRRLTETAHSCEAAVSLTSCTLRPFKLPLCVFKPVFFLSLSLLSISQTSSSWIYSLEWPPRQRGAEGFFFSFFFFTFQDALCLHLHKILVRKGPTYLI